MSSSALQTGWLKAMASIRLPRWVNHGHSNADTGKASSKPLSASAFRSAALLKAEGSPRQVAANLVQIFGQIPASRHLMRLDKTVSILTAQVGELQSQIEADSELISAFTSNLSVTDSDCDEIIAAAAATGKTGKDLAREIVREVIRRANVSMAAKKIS